MTASIDARTQDSFGNAALGTVVRFSERPSDEVLTALKAAGYRYSDGVWVGQGGEVFRIVTAAGIETTVTIGYWSRLIEITPDMTEAKRRRADIRLEETTAAVATIRAAGWEGEIIAKDGDGETWDIAATV